MARPPAPSTSRAARASPSSSRALTTTVAPRRPQARAIASPMPPEAPVTTTVRCSPPPSLEPAGDTAYSTRRYDALMSFMTISAVSRSVARLLLSTVSKTP